VTKSTSKKVRCVSCGEDYFSKRPHTCDLSKIRTGHSYSEPQRAKSRKMFFGKGGRK
jgi:hypothetical protein